MDANIVFNYSSTLVSNIVLIVGIVISFSAFFYFCISSGFSVTNFFVSYFFIFISSVIFGSLFYYLLYHQDIQTFEPVRAYLFKIYNLAFLKDNTFVISSSAWINDYGIIFGIVFGCILSSFVFNVNLYKLLDCCICPIFILLSSFRLSDLFICKNFGTTTESSFGVIFPSIDMLPRHACMLYEFVLLFIFAAVLFYIVRKISIVYKDDYNSDGYMFFLGIFLISVIKISFSVIKIQDNLVSNVLFDSLKLGANQFMCMIFLVFSLIFSVYRFPRKQ